MAMAAITQSLVDAVAHGATGMAQELDPGRRVDEDHLARDARMSSRLHPNSSRADRVRPEPEWFGIELDRNVLDASAPGADLDSGEQFSVTLSLYLALALPAADQSVWHDQQAERHVPGQDEGPNDADDNDCEGQQSDSERKR